MKIDWHSKDDRKKTLEHSCVTAKKKKNTWVNWVHLRNLKGRKISEFKQTEGSAVSIHVTNRDLDRLELRAGFV